MEEGYLLFFVDNYLKHYIPYLSNVGYGYSNQTRLLTLTYKLTNNIFQLNIKLKYNSVLDFLTDPRDVYAIYCDNIQRINFHEQVNKKLIELSFDGVIAIKSFSELLVLLKRKNINIKNFPPPIKQLIIENY